MPQAIEAPLPELDEDELAIAGVGIDFPRLLPDPESNAVWSNTYINSRVYDKNAINNMNQHDIGENYLKLNKDFRRQEGKVDNPKGTLKNNALHKRGTI